MAALASRSPNAPPQWFQEHCARLRESGCQIRNLNFNIRQLNPSMIVALSGALVENQSIRVINLTSSLTSAVLQKHDHASIILPLAFAIHDHVSLSTLHLSYNKLADASPLKLCIDAQKSRLTELHLDHNLLTEKTAFALAEALEKNTSLLLLQLDSNRLGEAGGVAIAKALRKNTCLQTLGLQRNRLGTRTANALLDSLQTDNFSLHRLYLGVNPDIPESIEAKCLRLVRANQCGRYLLRIEGREQDKDNYSERPNSHAKSLWPHILARREPDIVFFFLTVQPSLVPCNGR